jgi:hypothetical protein
MAWSFNPFTGKFDDAGGAGGSPAGADYALQLRLPSGLFGEAAGLTFDPSTKRLTHAAGTQTTAGALRALSAVWNAPGLLLHADDADITDTASASLSTHIRRRLNGIQKFAVYKDGSIDTEGVLYFNSTQTIGKSSAGNTLNVANNGTAKNIIGNGFFAAASGGAIGFTSDASWSFTGNTAGLDVILARGGPNILELVNGTAAQAFHAYNSKTDASNYERGVFKWSANVLNIGTEAAGTGTQRGVSFTAGSSTPYKFSFGSYGNNTIDTVVSGGSNVLFAREGYSVFGIGYLGGSSTSVVFGANTTVGFTSVANVASGSSPDTAFARIAAGILGLTNGSTGAASLEFREQTAPAAGAANSARLYAADDGAGNTVLRYVDSAGTVRTITAT